MRIPFVSSVLIALVAGCADAPHDEAPDDGQAGVCQAAADHLAACEGADQSVARGADPAPTANDCDTAAAEAILGAECDALGAGLNDAKADSAGYRRWACRVGLYRYCAEPTCDPEADEAEFDAAPVSTGSACLEDALRYRGCGACDYYRCREASAQCGEDAYLIRFAEKYCLRYRMVSEQHASPAGQRWLRDIRRCLVETLDAVVPGDECGEFETAGFDSHPGCYISTGFCDLPVSDWILVLNTIDLRDNNFRQMLTTSVGCLDHWLGSR